MNEPNTIPPAEPAATSQGEGARDGADDYREPPRLSRTSFWGSLFVLLAIFTFLNPIWKANEMDSWNENIWWSYLPIPVLVALCLAIERKLVFSALLLESMKLTFVKFTLTIVAANVLWEMWGTPGSGAVPRGETTARERVDSYEPREAPAATALDPSTLGRVEVRVVDAADRAVEGAWVWIASGLEEFVFEAPSEALALRASAGGFEPRVAWLRAWQPLELHSGDGALHTLVARRGSGQRLFNFPVLSQGGRPVMFGRDEGRLRIACSVHGADEPGADWIVTANPFHARSDARGGVVFEGVPARALAVRAWFGDDVEADARVSFGPGETASVELVRPLLSGN